MSETDICDNIKSIRQRIENVCEQCGRDPESVTLVAISKMKPADDIRTAYECGQVHFGENRVQEWEDKVEAIEEPVQWHMVGNLQTNKIKYLVDRIDWIHSIPKKKSLRELEKRASRIDRTINVLIQVNISDEDQKSGCDPDQLKSLLEYARTLEHVSVRGLMGIATFADDPEDVREEFVMLRKLRDQHKTQESDNIQLEHLSMGMTNDLEVAIQEGATMVRVGRAIFGERDYS